MAQTNFGHGNVPILVRTFDGGEGSSRTSVKKVGKSSEAFFLGEFVPGAIGTIAAPALSQGGVENFVAGCFLGYIVTGFSRRDSILPIQEDDAKAGTVTDATAFRPMKYTFSATNDWATATGARECVNLQPIFGGDIIETTLSNDAGTASVTRGTTTGSDTPGYGLKVEPDAPFAAMESSATATLAALDLGIVDMEGRLPSRTDRVFVQLLRPAQSALAAIS